MKSIDPSISSVNPEINKYQSLTLNQRNQIGDKLKQNIKNLFPVLHNKFHQFNHNMDLNISRFGNSQVEFSQSHPEIFSAGGQASLPTTVMITPPKEIFKEKMINYHPLRLIFRHEVDYLFHI